MYSLSPHACSTRVHGTINFCNSTRVHVYSHKSIGRDQSNPSSLESLLHNERYRYSSKKFAYVLTLEYVLEYYKCTIAIAPVGLITCLLRRTDSTRSVRLTEEEACIHWGWACLLADTWAARNWSAAKVTKIRALPKISADFMWLQNFQRTVHHVTLQYRQGLEGKVRLSLGHTVVGPKDVKPIIAYSSSKLFIVILIVANIHGISQWGLQRPLFLPSSSQSRPVCVSLQQQQLWLTRHRRNGALCWTLRFLRNSLC